MAYALGVDLGTTYTAAAVARDGHVEMATLGDRGVAVPSVLFLRDDGQMLVGEAAVRRGLAEPGRVAREFKRRVGDPAPLLLGGSPVPADALMGHLLRWVVDHVAEREGERPSSVTVTHPANWGPYKRELLDQAISRAGVRDITTTMTEPDAAATHYASLQRLEPGAVVAVYDLGGGTFDAAVLRKQPDGFELLGAPEGLERVGGIDFDEAVFGHVVAILGDTLAEMNTDDPGVVAALARLRDDCVAAKEALSSDTDVAIPVLLPAVQTEVRLTRGEFEAMIRPTLADTVDALGRALQSAGVAPGAVHAVLLVGGSSRIPLVGELVGRAIGRPVAVDVHPKHAVALGAAVHASPSEVAAPVATVPAGPAAAVEDEPVAAPLPPPAATGPRSRRPLIVAAIAVVVVVGAVITALALKGSGKDNGSSSASSSNTTDTTASSSSESTLPPRVPVENTTVDDGAGRSFKLARFETPANPISMAFGAGAGWAVARDDAKLLRIDPSSNQTVAIIPVGQEPLVATFAAGSVWVSNNGDNTVSRVDPATNQVTATIQVSGKPWGIAASDSAVWVARDDGRVVRIDPSNNQVATTIDVSGGGPAGLALGAGAVWMGDSQLSQLVRIDEATGKVDNSLRTGASPGPVAFGAGSVWVEDDSDNTVTRVDPDKLTVIATIPLDESAAGLIVVGTDVWVALPNSKQLARIDSATNKIAGKVTVADGASGPAFGEGTLWVAGSNEGHAARMTL